MGMSIDEQIDGLRKAAVICTSVFAYDCQGYIKEAIDTLCKYQQLQADYEVRLKADKVAMLTDLQLDVKGQKFDVHIDKDVWNDAIGVCSDLIQQRINELKDDTRPYYANEWT